MVAGTIQHFNIDGTNYAGIMLPSQGPLDDRFDMVILGMAFLEARVRSFRFQNPSLPKF